MSSSPHCALPPGVSVASAPVPDRAGVGGVGRAGLADRLPVGAALGPGPGAVSAGAGERSHCLPTDRFPSALADAEAARISGNKLPGQGDSVRAPGAESRRRGPLWGPCA